MPTDPGNENPCQIASVRLPFAAMQKIILQKIDLACRIPSVRYIMYRTSQHRKPLALTIKPSRLLVLKFEHRPGAKLSVPKSLRVFSVVSLVRVAFLRSRTPLFNPMRSRSVDFTKENNDF